MHLALKAVVGIRSANSSTKPPISTGQTTKRGLRGSKRGRCSYRYHHMQVPKPQPKFQICNEDKQDEQAKGQHCQPPKAETGDGTTKGRTHCISFGRPSLFLPREGEAKTLHPSTRENSNDPKKEKRCNPPLAVMLSESQPKGRDSPSCLFQILHHRSQIFHH